MSDRGASSAVDGDASGTDDPAPAELPAEAPVTVEPSPAGYAGPWREATFTAEGRSGAAGQFTVQVGDPVPVASVTDPVLAACSSATADDGAFAERTLAVPVRLEGRLTTAMATNVTVELAAQTEVASGGPEGFLGDDTAIAYWGVESDDGAGQCQLRGSGGAGPGAASWSVPANGALTWSTWVVLANVISPNDPTGEYARRLLIRPSVNLEGSGPGEALGWTGGDALVSCTDARSFGNDSTYIAFDTAVAHARGCTPWQAG